MSLCLLEEEVNQQSDQFIDQVRQSRQGSFLNGTRQTWQTRSTKELYVPVCPKCHEAARNGAGGPAHDVSSAVAAADLPAEDGEEVEVMCAIAASLEDFEKSQAEHLDGVGDAEVLAAAIRFSEMEY